jgi:hypothetical protein
MITKDELVAALRRGSSCQTRLGNLPFNTVSISRQDRFRPPLRRSATRRGSSLKREIFPA